MTSYIRELRRLVGSRPLIACGACVVLQDSEGRILLQYRADNGTWGCRGAVRRPAPDR